MEGQGVGTIPSIPAAEVDVAERAPAPGENFLNSDLMAFIDRNDVICLNCGRNAGSLRIYLQQLFRKAQFEDGSRQFELGRVGLPDTLALIAAKRVKSIDLGIDIAEATSAELLEGARSDSTWDGIKSGVATVFHAITARDETVERLRTATKGKVRVSVSVPNGDIDTAKSGIDSLAEDIIDDDEASSYVINLRDGNTINANEVSVKKGVYLDPAANSVSVSQAWDAMELFVDELRDSGQLEA
jgi:hypothetical protein